MFLTKDGRVKILDFGLAKLTPSRESEEKTSLPTQPMGTDPGVVMGTAAYMSPEQVRGRPWITAQTFFLSERSSTRCWRDSGLSRAIHRWRR